MATLVFQPSVPANPVNYMVPSRISAWWRTICPDGSLDNPIELGSISEISFTPNETTLDLKSARTGILTTDKRIITDVSGTLSFKIHEMVGSNLNLLFRPVSITTVTGATGKLMFGQDRINLTATDPITVGIDAVDYVASTQTTVYKDVTIIRVEAQAIADPVSGRSTQYTSGVDYSFTQATSGTQFELIHGTSLGGASTGVVNETLAFGAFVDFSSVTAGALPAASATAFSGTGSVVAFDGGNTPTLSLGDVIDDATNTAPIVGFMYTDVTPGTVTGIIWTGAPTAGSWTGVAGGTAFTTVEGFSADTVGVTVAQAFTTVTVSATQPSTGSTGATAAGGSLFVTGVAGVLDTANSGVSSSLDYGTGQTLVGNMGTYTGGGLTVIVSGASAASTAQLTIVENDSAAKSMTVTETVAGTVAARLRPGIIMTTSIGAGLLPLLSSASAGGSTPAKLTRIDGGAIADGAAVTVAYSYRRDADCYSILDGVIIEGQLQLQVLSVNGPQSVYTFYRVNIGQSGANSINPEERSEPTLEAVILPDGTGRRGEFCLLKNFTGFALSDCT